ncbi:MAG: PQQ-dependent sugar dehydrogenase [Planctomycetales bacterium]|nr:PQQ-dependent sugar dehydrogenase [Planctomycetales bacterium]
MSNSKSWTSAKAMSRLSLLSRSLSLALLIGIGSAVNAQNIPAERVATGLEIPVFATYAPGDPTRLFIVEQRTGADSDTGRIQILDLTTGTLNVTPFLTVPGLDNASEEQGLLGLAFHPDYQNNGFFYLTESYIGHTDIVRYQATSPDTASTGNAQTILTYSQPHDCHNGNWIGFGPDGMLYHTSGDGGSQHDGFGNAQNKTTLNGSVVRIDVGADGLADDFPTDPNRNYAIPASNPFVGEGGGVREELWSIGLRNPWRASFDRLTGDFYIGDTSQDTLELINFQHAGAAGGQNYGWPLREGTIATPTGGVGGPKPPGAIDPIYEYLHTNKTGTIGSATALGHNQGNSTIGGYVYRGPNNAMQSNYFFADFVSQHIWSIEFDGTADPLDFDGTQTGSSYIDWKSRIVPDAGSIGFISSFGEDYEGNLYVVDYVGGEVFRLEPNFYDADFDLDGDVDADNFADWENAFGESSGADADADGDSDGLDFLSWQRLFGSQPPPLPDPDPVVWTSGVSGSWRTSAHWSDGIGTDPQNAQTTFGSTTGWDSNDNIARANIVIDGSAGATNVLFDSDANPVADFSMNANGEKEGSLTISGGATFEIRSTTTPDARWSQHDAALLRVTGAGSQLLRTHTDPNKNGGAFIFGSWRSQPGQVIRLEVLDQGSLDNEGQMWFGAYDSSEIDLDVTWEVGAGASINTHDALGGGISLDNTAGAEGEINFIWNYDSAAGAPDDSTYTIDLSGHGGSVTVDEEGIRYQVEIAPGVWTTTLKTYQQLWADGRLTASTATPGGAFGDYFAVIGGSGFPVYRVTNIQGAPLGDASAASALAANYAGGLTADINGDLVVDETDLAILLNNFGTGTTVSQGDINLAAPGDNLVDAADAGVMLASLAAPSAPEIPGTATAEYNPATGEIIVTVDSVSNWYIESGSSSLTAKGLTALLTPGSLATDNDTRIGETALERFSFSNHSLGIIAEAGLPLGDLTLVWNAGWGQPLQRSPLQYLGAVESLAVPEPTTVCLLAIGLAICHARTRRDS